VATEDAVRTTGAAAPQGHPTGFWFFFWGEFAERCSYYGMRAILALYMVDRLGISKADAGTYMSLFIAACYFFPLIGGYVADNFLGKYWTIVLFAIPYVLAQFIVGIEDRYVVFAALALLAMGSGVIKPNISTLMGLTYDQQRPGQEQLRSNAFSWFYMAINIGAALSQFAMPWLRTEYGYRVAFLFPAGLMAIALAIFAAGKRFYGREVIERKVIGAPGESIPEGRTVTGLPVRYTVVTAEEKAADRALKLQTLGRIGLLFLTVMFFWAIFDQSASTWIFFADTYMDTNIFGYEVSADAFQAFNPVFIICFLPLSVILFNSLANKGYKIRATDKMVAGFVLTALSMVIMSLSGFLAGQKQDAIKVTLQEGEVILPMSDTPLNEVRSSATFGGASGPRLAASDPAYNEENKKLTLSSGELTFADGKKLVIKDGRIDFEQSRDLFAAGTVAPAGALETKFRSGDYPMGGDRLTIGRGNTAAVKPGERVEAPQDKEPAKVTLERVDWTKPAERVTVWWQVLAYLILTWGEILISVTGLELAFVAAPQTMKSFVTACWLAVVFLANLLINAPITRLYPYMEPGVYFAMLAGAMVAVTAVFFPIAARFNRGMNAAAAANGRPKEGDTEAV
jgi:dipeptide/tripeptide permease